MEEEEKLDPRKEYEINEQLAYENSKHTMMDMFYFWTGRAVGIKWCIKHLDDKVVLKKEYEDCLQAKDDSVRINAQNFVRYYDGRADGVRWCLDNFDNLELPEEPAGKEK